MPSAGERGDLDGRVNGRGVTVLLVDDDSEFRETLRDVLSGRGYRVISARDGSDAVAALRAHRPHVVLLDYVMPRVDGASLVRTLRQTAATRDIAIVMMSGLPEDMVRPVCDDYDVYLAKPVDTQSLLLAVQRALSLRSTGASPSADAGGAASSGGAGNDPLGHGEQP